MKRYKPLDLTLEYEVRDKNGKIIKRGKQKSHSWLKQWIQFVYAVFASRYGGDTPATYVNDVTGTSRRIPFTSTNNFYRLVFTSRSASGDSAYGLVIGTNGIANAKSQYKLNMQITHGTGSGQMVHGDTFVEAVYEPDPTSFAFRMYRTFTNLSGADITVKECGLYNQILDYDGYARVFCTIRDLLNPPDGVVVPHGATLTIRYTFIITVS